LAYLKKVTVNWDKVEDKYTYPFNVPAISNLDTLNFDQNVTFLIGENGTGKSTLLEAIAYKCGFALGGGGQANDLGLTDESLSLSSVLTLSWMPKINSGFFLRAETFFDFAKYIDEMAKDPYSGGENIVYRPYGGTSLNKQSHGEAFLSLFTNRFNGKGLFILDEPEAALSPQRQFSFLRLIHDLETEGRAQFIIASHSPILMAYPGARIYSCDDGGINQIDYEETDHYRLTKAFLDNRLKFFRRLFED
jgi:predicted ATPase